VSEQPRPPEAVIDAEAKLPEDSGADVQFRSASGLRPASAFVVIGFVLALVAVRAAILALYEDGEQPANLMRLPILPVGFELVDAAGVPMARSVDYLELVSSPNALWQAHTPDLMATRLAEALGKPNSAADLLAEMLPDAENGVVTARLDKKTPLYLDEAQKNRVVAWLESGTLDPDEEVHAPIEGFRLVRTNAPGRYTLAWMPSVVLSEKERARHDVKKPLDWSRRLCDELGACLLGDRARDIDTDDERAVVRARVWKTLMPTQFKSVVKEVPVERAAAVHELLKRERVQTHQMDIRRNQKRAYPMKGNPGDDQPALAVLGRFGTIEPDAARRLAIEELRLPADDSLWSTSQIEAFNARSRARIFQPSPMSGLELYSKSLLEKPEWRDWLQLRGEEYTYFQNQVPRQPVHHYFQELIEGDQSPRIGTTIELGLQRSMRVLLERAMEVNDPALAMAIAVDVETGDVLAVDAIDKYGMGGFLPTLHTYTPGSTLKAVVMAAALEEGVVTPDEQIDAHHDTFVFEGRRIHEADGAKDKNWVSAAEGLAYSINAVLVQIGTRMTDAALRGHLIALGYARAPEAGLGSERVGTLLRLPWSRRNTQASICFGHELHVTMWQHAAALATILRGGHYRPLRLVKSVEQYGVKKAIPLVEDHPLQARDSLSKKTCDEVRAMMELGAKIGTGKKVWRDDIVMGTKTGTAQRVGTELCLHVELAHNREHDCHGNRACRLALVGKTAHKGACYTSSMCIFGHRPEGGREVMVYVVVDEPRGRFHFGSDVAGPVALGVLREALGFTSLLEEVAQPDTSGFHTIALTDDSASDQPWAEVLHGAH
jgi:cell division protein FtsI/penicillin-binding protein 2